MKEPNNTPASRLMSPKSAALATTLSMPLLRAMSLHGLFPKPMLIGVKRIAYVRAEVEGWIQDRINSRSLEAA